MKLAGFPWSFSRTIDEWCVGGIEEKAGGTHVYSVSVSRLWVMVHVTGPNLMEGHVTGMTMARTPSPVPDTDDHTYSPQSERTHQLGQLEYPVGIQILLHSMLARVPT